MHGKRLLCLRPYEGPAEPPWVGATDALALSVNLPGEKSISLIFWSDRRAALITALHTAHAELAR